METAQVNRVKLEYEVVGAGEPVLLVSPVLADGFLPLLSERVLSDRHQLIRYHKRGWLGSTRTPGPVTIADHAADAAALLEHLGIRRAHIAGHSSGAAVALQLALDHPEVVQTLCLLEPSLLAVPSAEGFFKRAQPAFDAYAAGRHDVAVAIFMSVVSGLDWEQCRAVLDARIPGAVAQAIQDADTFFGVELPALTEWAFTAHDAATIRQPVLSVVGTKTEPLWVEVASRLRAWLPALEECRVDGAGHLLHIQRPALVAQAIADFLGRNPMPSTALSKAQEQVAELKKMFAATAEARAERQRAKPLYERLGGRAALEPVVADIIELHFTEEITKPIMNGVDKQKLIRLVVEWLCRASGGAEKYTGRDMVSAHAHLNMTDVHFMAAGDQVMRVLTKYEVPEPEAQEVLCAIVAHHDDVVR
jgi:3-oxoadipate enol-lactonase